MSSEYDPHEEPESTVTYEAVRRRPRTRARLVMAGVAMVTLAAFAGVVWYAYQVGVRAGSERVAPLVKAEKGPVKVRPETPGGMEVPYQDKLVYNRLAPESAEKPVERLLPPPETPLPRPQPAVGEKATKEEGAEAAAAGDRLEPPKVLGREGTATPPAPTAEREVGAVPPSPPAAASGGTKAESKVAARTEGPSAAAQTGRYRVQLVSLGSEAAARKAWDRVRKRNADLLGGLTLTVERADLGEKGVFYRVQAGPVADEAAARKLCAALGERKQACLVVRR